MLRIRIGTGRLALLVILFAACVTATGASAQSDAGSVPGKPLQLVQNTSNPSKAAAVKSNKIAAKAKARHHHDHVLARSKHAPAPVQVAQQTTDAWSAAPALPFPGAAAATPPAPPPAELAPSELVVDGQTVQISPPDQVNEIDLAAKSDAASSDAARAPAADDAADTAAKSDLTSAATPANEVGSTAWLLQVLAALGGAVAAGSAAWFLIGSAPQRMYG